MKYKLDVVTPRLRTARAAERKLQQLWSGTVRLPSPNAGPPVETRVCAFAVRGCSQSQEAAAQLPAQMEGTVESAEDAGAPKVPSALMFSINNLSHRLIHRDGRRLRRCSSLTKENRS